MGEVNFKALAVGLAGTKNVAGSGTVWWDPGGGSVWCPVGERQDGSLRPA